MLRSAGFTAEFMVFDLSSCLGSRFGLYDAEDDRLGWSPHLCVLRSLKNNQKNRMGKSNSAVEVLALQVWITCTSKSTCHASAISSIE
jgi:hypothetical protein